MVFKLFRKKVPTETGINIDTLDLSALPTLNAEGLIKLTGQTGRVKNIRRILTIDESRFLHFYKNVIDNFANIVQLMPASQTHHHAVPGGLFIHTLEVIELAITYRQRYKLPAFATQETQEQQRHAWTYAIFIAALLHDIGKRVTMCNFIVKEHGKQIPYSPFNTEMIAQKYSSYEIEFNDPKYHHLHEKVGLVFMNKIVPVEGQRFLFENLSIVEELFAFIHGDKFKSGNIGKIIAEADMASTGKSLAHIKTRKFQGSSLENIGERLMTKLRILLASNEIITNKPSSQCFTDEKYAYLVCPAFIDTLRNSFYDDGETDIPGDNNRIFDIFQEYGFSETNPATGKSIHWIATQIEDKVAPLVALKFELVKLFQVIPNAFEGKIREIAGSEFKKIQSGFNFSETTHTSVSKQNEETGTGKSSFEEHSNFDSGSISDFESGTDSGYNIQTDTGNTLTTNSGTGIESIAKASTSAQTNKKDYSSDFMNWIRSKIKENDSNIYKINKAGGLVSYVLSDGNPCVALITPKVFAEFAKETNIPLPEKSWKQVQNDIHNNSLNIKAGGGQVHYMRLKKSQRGEMNKSPTLSYYLFSMKKFCDGDDELIKLFTEIGKNENLYFAPRKKSKYPL